MCRSECRRFFMPSSWGTYVVRTAITTFIMLLPVAGTAVYAYAATRERIATMEAKVENLEDSVRDIKGYTIKSHRASSEVLEEIRKIRAGLSLTVEEQ